MANADTPRGLVPIQSPTGTDIHVEYFYVTSGYTTDIGVYSPVKLASSGFITLVTSATAANQQFLGAAMEFYDASAMGTKRIAVACDPNQHFLIQESTTTTGATQAAVGASCAFINPATVNTTTELSATEAGGFGTTASAPLRILGKHERSTNAWGVNVDLIVKPIHGLHQMAGAAGI